MLKPRFDQVPIPVKIPGSAETKTNEGPNLDPFLAARRKCPLCLLAAEGTPFHSGVENWVAAVF